MDNKKNVVFILVDDLGWNDLGFYGSTFYETPNLDRLAEQGNVFTNAYTPNPVCSPTRAAILTGKYPTRIGITDWIPGRDPQDRALLGPKILNHLPLEEVTIAETLKEADYKTFFAGKWHLGDTGFFPEDQGFDINKGGHHKGQPPGGYYSPYNNPKLTDGPDGEYLTDRLTDESISFLEENKEKPFLLYLSYYTVHTPIQASKKHIAKFRAKQKMLKDTMPKFENEGAAKTVINQYNPEYASMVYALDENVGRLLDKLETLNLMDNTLIVFTSDNGGLSTLEGKMNNRDAPTSVRPLRGGKGWAYEGGIRVPLIIKEPGKNQHRTIHTPVISMDLFPSILDVLDLPQRPDLHKDGLSLRSLMNNQQTELNRVLFWDYPHYHGSGWTPGQALRKGDWKLIYFYESDTYELYNLKSDISERNNLSTENPEKLKELKKELKTINDDLKTKKPTINI
ncbi:sulfatase [Arenibacter certesii]|uniref:sulfatase n=1 Tax=Arenibacter certesii TaxID=228955 RepID=UPI001969D66B|nr:sulfatase [Arenibacter certesii]